MFDAVLKPSSVPRRRLGTGAAFAVAAHLWLLVAGLARSGHPEEPVDPTPVAVSFVVPSPAPGPPPPLGDGRPARSGKASPGPKVPPKRPVPRPTEAPPPDAPEPSSGPADGPPGDGAPGAGNGTGDGDGTGGDPNGVVGGTGVAPVSGTLAPTSLTISIGDPALDQSTCQLLAQPPYPQEALAQKIEGVVVARCTVEPDGALSGCNVLKASYPFEPPVRSFLATARARPFTASGRPVRVACNFTLRFKLAN